MSSLPTMEVQLPSNGFGYDPKYNIPEKVTIRMLSVAEMKILLDAGNDINHLRTRLLASCIQEPIDPKDLFVADAQYVFFMLRAFSIGEDYKIRCTCGACGHHYTLCKKIPDDFGVKTVTGEHEFNPKIILPLSGIELGLKLLTGKDEEVLYKAQLKKEDNRIIDRMASHIMTLRLKDSKEVNTQYPIISRIIQELSFKDMQAFDDALNIIEFGLQTVTTECCPKCNAENQVMLSFNENFFRN